MAADKALATAREEAYDNACAESYYIAEYFFYLARTALALAKKRYLFLEEKYLRVAKHYGATCLDVGSGYGDFALFLDSQGIAMTLIDIVDRGTSSHLSVNVFDGRHIPFSDASFDTSIIMFVLHHVQDQEGLLREARRVTRGRIIVGEDLLEAPFDRLMGALHLLASAWSSAKDSFHSDRDWRLMFDRLGLRVIESLPIPRYKEPIYPIARRIYVLEAG